MSRKFHLTFLINFVDFTMRRLQEQARVCKFGKKIYRVEQKATARAAARCSSFKIDIFNIFCEAIVSS